MSAADASPKPAGTSTAQIRRRAAAGVVYCFCVGIPIGLYYGNPLPRAVATAAVAALAGAAAWTVYHAASRRSDGLLLVVMGLPITSREYFFLPAAVLYILAMALVGWLASLTVPRADPDAENASPAREPDRSGEPPATGGN
jgi:hypothetical protein